MLLRCGCGLVAGTVWATVSLAGISEKASEQIKDARTICRELGEIVPKLEASGRGQYSRMQYEVLRYSLDAIDTWELPKGRTNRVEQQAKEMMDFAPAALSRAKRILSGEDQDLQVPRFKGGDLKVCGPILFGTREWPDGREDHGHSVMLNGWGHFAGVTRDQEILNRMGFNFQQLEIRMEDVLPAPGVTNLAGFALLMETSRKAAANHTKIDFHPGLHYAPKWMTDKSSVTNCQNGFMHFCLHDEVMAKEVVDFARYAALRVKGNPNVSSICLTNEPQSKDVSGCPEFEKIWVAYLKEKFGTVEAMNAAWRTSYPSFAAVRRCAFPKLEKTPECLELIRCERKALADFNERIRNAVKEVVPEIPVHAKVVMDHSFLSSQENMFWCIDARRFAEMMDWHDCDPIYFYDSNDADLYASVWQRSQAAYDFLRSFAVKPMIDSENHNVVDNSSNWNPPEHFYSALWQNAMHGQRATAVWSWDRGECEGSCFNGLLPSRPACLEAFARCSLDLQRLSDEIAPIQVQRPTILVMCSLASQVLGENGFLFGYMGASFVGEPLGVITDEALERFDSDGEKRLPLDTAKVIILPSVTHLTRGALSALRKLEKEGVRILVSGPAPAHDDCNREVVDMPWKSMCGPHEQHIHPALVEMLKGVDLPQRPRLVRPVFGVETHSYERKGRRFVSLCNHLRKPVEVELGASGLDLISMKPVEGRFALQPMMPLFVELAR